MFTKNTAGLMVPSRMAGAAGTTRLVDAVIPELFNSYLVDDTVELTAFADSGVMQTSPLIDRMVQNGGGTITVPFWKDLDADEEPNYSNDDPAKRATPDKLQSGEQLARVAFLNNGWASADLVKELAGSNPNERIASRVDYYWARQFQKRVLATTVGLYQDNVAANNGDMTVDISADVTNPSFNINAFIDAAYTMGDHVGTLRVVGMHSVIAKRIAKDDQIETIRDSEGNILYMAYKDVRIVIDDSMPTFGTGVDRTYLTVLFGAGAITYGNGQPLVPTEPWRDPQGGQGGGVEQLWSRKTWLIHPTGYKFLSASLTGNGGTTDDGVPFKNASWADLRNAANWERVVDRKKVNMAFLITKA